MDGNVVFLMATTQFDLWRTFWSTKTINMFEGIQMRLGEYMLRTKFGAFKSALNYTDKPPPTYKDGFWEVIRLIDEWNANMKKSSCQVGCCVWTSQCPSG